MSRVMFRAFLAGGVTAAALSVSALAQSSSATPDFSSNGVAWQQGNGGELNAVPGVPGPMTVDPAYPYVPNGAAPSRRSASPIFPRPILSNGRRTS